MSPQLPRNVLDALHQAVNGASADRFGCMSPFCNTTRRLLKKHCQATGDVADRLLAFLFLITHPA